MGERKGGSDGGRKERRLAVAAGFLLLLLSLAFLVEGEPAGTVQRVLPFARAAFLFLSLVLSLAFLSRFGRLPAREAPPVAVGTEDGPPSPGAGDRSAGEDHFDLRERNRELLAHHSCTKRMMHSRSPGEVFQVLLQGIREGLDYPGAVMALLDPRENLVFLASAEGEGGNRFEGFTVMSSDSSPSTSCFLPLVDSEEPRFFEGVPPVGAEEYRRVAGEGKALVIPLLHRGWSGRHEEEGEVFVPDTNPDRIRPALIVLRSVATGKEISPSSVKPVLSLLKEADTALGLVDMYRRLRALSITDGLTGLLNHREFHERLSRETERAKRYGHNLSVMILDVDDFKQFNDRYGHPAGDKVLRILASLLRQAARGTDIVARYGGEEFALILPEGSSTGALLMAERIRTSLASVNISPVPDREERITVSIGIYTSETGTASDDIIVTNADEAAYQAKKDGKNRVVLRAGP